MHYIYLPNILQNQPSPSTNSSWLGDKLAGFSTYTTTTLAKVTSLFGDNKKCEDQTAIGMTEIECQPTMVNGSEWIGVSKSDPKVCTTVFYPSSTTLIHACVHVLRWK